MKGNSMSNSREMARLIFERMALLGGGVEDAAVKFKIKSDAARKLVGPCGRGGEYYSIQIVLSEQEALALVKMARPGMNMNLMAEEIVRNAITVKE